ncbi:hypothetical protein M8C21_032146 [Ambrosia artemisiifolia]|uniref:Uncharacterized protein n=1 Tax=Ambrosia artemisiifolia TaxID=4212 RepID=A0AAD5C9U5_AMBAR|nr:hypothetical protein M8C21_032146 [Ambrosia artemisiifolia]
MDSVGSGNLCSRTSDVHSEEDEKFDTFGEEKLQKVQDESVDSSRAWMIDSFGIAYNQRSLLRGKSKSFGVDRVMPDSQQW